MSKIPALNCYGGAGMFRDYFKALFINVPVELLTVLIVSFILIRSARIRSRYPNLGWSGVVLAFVVITGLLLFTSYQVGANLQRWNTRRLVENPRVLEGKVREWLIDGGYSVASVSRPDAHFMIRVSDGTSLYQPKEGGKFLNVQTTVQILNRRMFDPLTADPNSPVVSQLIVELARSGVHWTVVGRPLREVLLGKPLPLSQVNEFAILETMHTVRQAAIVTVQTLGQAWKASERQRQPPPSR